MTAVRAAGPGGSCTGAAEVPGVRFMAHARVGAVPWWAVQTNSGAGVAGPPSALRRSGILRVTMRRQPENRS